MCKLYCKPCATEFDGTPCAVKAARTVWSRGKVGDYIKDLPMAIRLQKSGHEAAHGWRRCRSGGHHPDSSAERPVRLRTAGGFIPPVHTQSLPSLLWITAPIIIGSHLQTNIHPSTKGGAIMQLLTHIIFILNLLKTLINHFT